MHAIFYINNGIQATVVYRCSKVIHRLRENKSGLQTKTEVNTSTLRGKERNRNTEVQQKTKTTMQHTQKRTIK